MQLMHTSIGRMTDILIILDIESYYSASRTLKKGSSDIQDGIYSYSDFFVENNASLSANYERKELAKLFTNTELYDERLVFIQEIVVRMPDKSIS